MTASTLTKRGGARAGSGRKVGYRKENALTTYVRLRVTHEEHATLQRVATAHGLTVSDYIREKLSMQRSE
jgi:hypothetical protein